MALAAPQAIRYTGASVERYFSERPDMSMSTVPRRRHRCLFWLYRQQGRRTWGSGSRFSALCTALTLLILLTVSGPHRVHHLVEQHPQHNNHHSHDDQAQQGSECPILFLIQHTPVTEGCMALLPALFLVAEPIACTQPLRACALPHQVFQARAPPTALL
jgi:hypothetical protein